MEKRKFILPASILLVAMLSGCTTQPQLGPYGSDHAHADFRVYILGAAYNFSQEKYQTIAPAIGGEECGGNDSKLAHLHDGDGDVVHKHATGVTWGYFFSTLNMSLTDSCLYLDNGTVYCNGQGNGWRFFVNGKETGNLKDREIANLDRVLFTYGPGGSVAGELASVTSKASQEVAGNICKVS